MHLIAYFKMYSCIYMDLQTSINIYVRVTCETTRLFMKLFSVNYKKY